MPQLNRISATQSISFLKSTPDISHNEDDHYRAILNFFTQITIHSTIGPILGGDGSEPGVRTTRFDDIR